MRAGDFGGKVAWKHLVGLVGSYGGIREAPELGIWMRMCGTASEASESIPLMDGIMLWQ